MISDQIKKHYVKKYKELGKERFYKFLLSSSIEKLSFADIPNNNPEIELLSLHDSFIISFRKNEDEQFLQIAKLFRKAAHKIYRIMLKKKLTEKNSKFLNLAA